MRQLRIGRVGDGIGTKTKCGFPLEGDDLLANGGGILEDSGSGDALRVVLHEAARASRSYAIPRAVERGGGGGPLGEGVESKLGVAVDVPPSDSTVDPKTYSHE